MNYALNKIMKQVRGVSYSKNVASLTYKEGFVPILRAGNIQNSRIVHDDFVYIPNEGVKNVQLLKEGDVLIAASSGSISIVGKAAMILQDMNAGFGAFCKVLRPNKEIINENYFKFYFETPHYKNTISQLAEGANINNLKTEHFDNLEIYLPPLVQQQKIANILDLADALRQNEKALITKYDELIQALFLDMFGDPVSNPKKWEKKEFKNYTLDVKNGITRRPKTEEDNFGNKVLKLKHIRSNFINYDCENRIILEESEKQKFDVKVGDLLFIRVNGNPDYVGRCALHNNIDQEVYYNDHIMRVRYNLNFYNGLFLSQYLNFPYGQNEISKQIKTSAGQHTINQGGLEKLNLIVPHLDIQNQFAERVAIIEEQKANAQASLEKSEELFQSLLQKAFKGEL